MALIADQSNLLTKIFAIREYNGQGVYGVQLCLDGTWENVTVDDRFPCDEEGRLVFSRVS